MILLNMEKIKGVFSGQDLEAIENMPIEEGFAFTQKKLELFFGRGRKGRKADSISMENTPLLEFIIDTPYKTLASFVTRMLFLDCQKRYIAGNLPIQDKLSNNDYWKNFCYKRITPEEYVEDTIAYLSKIRNHFQEGKEARLTKREIILHDIISWPSISKYTKDNIRASKQIQKELRDLESLIKDTQVFYGFQTLGEFLRRTNAILEKNNLEFTQDSSDYMQLYLDSLFE